MGFLGRFLGGLPWAKQGQDCLLGQIIIFPELNQHQQQILLPGRSRHRDSPAPVPGIDRPLARPEQHRVHQDHHREERLPLESVETLTSCFSKCCVNEICSIR